MVKPIVMQLSKNDSQHAKMIQNDTKSIELFPSDRNLLQVTKEMSQISPFAFVPVEQAPSFHIEENDTNSRKPPLLPCDPFRNVSSLTVQFVVNFLIILMLSTNLLAVLYMWKNEDNHDTLELTRLAGEIRYYDEALTMSTFMYATTLDPLWKERYFSFVDPMDDAIKQVHEVSPQIAREFFYHTDTANQKLVSLEYKTLKQTDKIKSKDILNNTEYKEQKKILANGLVLLNQRIRIMHSNSVIASMSTITFGIISMCFGVFLVASYYFRKNVVQRIELLLTRVVPFFESLE